MNVPFHQHQNMVNMQKMNSANLVKSLGIFEDYDFLMDMAFYVFLIIGIGLLCGVILHFVNLILAVFWFQFLEDFVIFP